MPTAPLLAHPEPPLSLLVVEDDAALRATLAERLTSLGYVVSEAVDGRAATLALAQRQHDVVLLDRMLPGQDGIDVLHWMRREGLRTPVILLTALGRTVERVEGLEGGADDYVTKPFDIEELNARIRAVHRRRAPEPVESRATLTAGDITLSLLAHRAFRGGKTVELQKTELALLAEFVRNPELVLTRQMLLERVWGYDFTPTTNIVEAYIRRLRMKLEVPGLPDPIVTIRGVGYKLRS